MKWLACIVTCLLILPASGNEMKLSLDWNKVSLEGAFPITGGVPFERGALTDAANVAMQVGDQRIPLQITTLATWPDGSIKWLLLDFQAQTTDTTATLHYGPNTTPGPAPAKPIQAAATDEGVTIDTGQVRLVIRKDGSGFIDELTYRGKALFTHDPDRRLNVMDALHTNAPADYHPMDRYLRDATADPSQVVVTDVSLEQSGPLRAVVVIDGVYQFQHMGKTIEGTEIKGACPFRIRVHAYAGQAMLKVEHFFYYEGDGDHDFVQTLSLRTPLPDDAAGFRFLSNTGVLTAPGPMAGLYQQNADSYSVWTSEGRSVRTVATGQRFQGVLDVKAGDVSVAVGVKDFWQNAAKSLHVDLTGKQMRVNLWAPEAPPLDFRRHARQWSVGEAGTPNDPNGTSPRPFGPNQANYRLASKGVGKTHYTLIFPHDASLPDDQILSTYRLFNQRPLLWAEPAQYANSRALGRYREYVPGEYEELEKALDAPSDIWRFSQEHFRWYGFWIYGNVLQAYNNFELNGRWVRDFGRWGWANGDTVGRLGYALMLQTVRKTQRADFEFAEAYIHNIHDVCSTHTPAYPHTFGRNFVYIKGASHRHGAWPWADTYVGVRGAHPMGAKIYYYLTGEGRAKDILEELAELAIKNPNGGAGDGPLGHNALMFLYRWETTGDDKWRDLVKKEIDESELLHKAEGGWLIMMSAAFGIHNAMEEYVDLTGDDSFKELAAGFADRAMPAQMKNHWTWGGYYRVYAHALNVTGDKKYFDAIEEMVPVYLSKMRSSWAGHYASDQWPSPAGGPGVLIDANIIRDIPFTLHAIEQYKAQNQ